MRRETIVDSGMTLFSIKWENNMRLKNFDDLYDTKTGKYITDQFYREILRLDRMLCNEGIPHVLQKHTDGWQIIYPKDGEERIMDAIENFGGYGSDKDLLEIMGLLTPEEEQHDRVVGYLTAQNVFERIMEHYRKNYDKTNGLGER